MISEQEVKLFLPSETNLVITQEFIDECNNIPQIEPEYVSVIKENFVTYTSVLKKGKFKLVDYLMAVKYVSFQLMGMTNRESYVKTFPKNYTDWVSRNLSEKDINCRITAYNKNKLVNLIKEQAYIPVWILNQDAYQKAINCQLDIMANSKSDIARCNASNSLLTHLKKPEGLEIDININTEDNTGLKALRESMKNLAEMQIQKIKEGISTKDISEQPIIDITPRNI
jgi:hypothetical protein